MPNRNIDGYECGVASWYGDELAGHTTASGEVFDPKGLTAAHRTFPFGTWLEVVREKNGQRVEVRVNDRGPHKRSRILDLSKAAAAKLGMLRDGVANVCFRGRSAD